MKKVLKGRMLSGVALLSFVLVLTVSVIGCVLVHKKNNTIIPKTALEELYKLPQIDTIISDLTLNDLAHLRKFLEPLKNIVRYKKRVNIFIDTRGGYIKYAQEITKLFKGFENYGIDVYCYYTKALSAGFTVLQACTKRIALKGALIGIHKCKSLNGEYAAMLCDINRARFEVKKLGGKLKDHNQRRKKEFTYFYPEEALKNNFIDEVLK